MNILQMEDMVKGLPDQMLMQEAQMPSGRIPQFLALSEVQRRKEMRDRMQKPPEATVADQILQGGIASAMPQQPPQGGMAPPQGPPPGGPPGPQGPVMAYGGGRMPYGMYGGGQVPYRMQEGRTVPGTNPAISDLNARIASAIMPRRAQFTVIREAKALRDQGKIDEAINLLTQERIDPRQVFAEGAPQSAPPAAAPPAPAPEAASSVGQTDMLAFPMRPIGLTPDFSAMAAPSSAPGMAPPADVGAVQQPTDMASLFNQISSGMSTGGGRSTNLAQGVKPFEQYFQFDPNAPALQATDLSPLVQQQEKRGAERAASYAETIKNIENEMKRERLGAVLTTLGANLMAGEGAAGLEKAGALAQQMGKEARQEIAAERRSARAAEEATADRIFALNAQQLTADKEAQRAIFNAQQNVKEKAFAAFSDKMKNEQQAAQAASQLAATLTVGAVNSMRDKIVTEGANARAVLDFAKEQARSLKDTLGTSTVGMAAADIQKLVEETLISGIITGYKAIGQAPPRGFESQVRAAAATTGGTASESDPLGLRR